MTYHLWLLVLVATLIVTVSRRRFSPPLSRYPGPFLASITRLWYTYINWRGLQHVVLPALHEKYGDIVRVAPNEVHIRTPEALQAIYGAGSKCVKSDWFKVFQGNRGFDLVSERDQFKHGQQRRLVAQVYSATSLKDQEKYIDETLDGMFRKFDTFIGQPFDLSDWIQYWSFDTMGMLTFSKPFGFVEAGRDWNQALHQIRTAGDSAAWVGQNPWLYQLLQSTLFRWLGNPCALANRNGAVRKFAINQCTRRQEAGAATKPDIMEKLLRIRSAKPTQFTDDALHSMVATNIFGGAETTTSSMRAVLYFLLKNEPAMQKVRQEIDRVCQENNWPRHQPISLSLTASMPYLEAVIYESMRLFPANGLPLARVVPETGLVVNNHFFPPGTQVTVYSWALHRSKDVFGDDADEFNPERWLDDKTSRALRRSFFSFGYGARGCLGRHLAWMEMAKGVSSLLARYDIALEDDSASWTVNGAFIKSQRDINVILSARDV